MDTNIKVIIIPDVHGRTFWKKCIEKYKEEIEARLVDVVFLGDYLDPYPFENITVKDAIKNFKEICEFAKDKTNVHMLLGNHDMPYYDQGYCHSFSYKCRYSHRYADEIEDIFKKYNIFNIAWETKVNGKKYLFTHAGVLKAWVDIHRGDLRVRRGDIQEEMRIPDLEPTAESLNKLTHSVQGIFALTDVSESRGGYCAYGSVIWADVHEHIDSLMYGPCINIKEDSNGYYYKDIYQVFGHSLGYPGGTMESLDMYVIEDKFAMLDSRRGFTLNDEGKIEEIKFE